MSNGTVDQHPDVFHDTIAEQPTCNTLNYLDNKDHYLNIDDKVKVTESEASGPGLRNPETIVENRVLCRNKYYILYSARLGLPYITFSPEIDPKPPPTFESEDLLTSNTWYEIQEKKNKYVDKAGIFWRSFDYLEVVGWRHNCWTRYLQFKGMNLGTWMLQMKTKIIEIVPKVDYQYIVRLFLINDSWKGYTMRYSDDEDMPRNNIFSETSWSPEKFNRFSTMLIGTDDTEDDYPRHTVLLEVPGNLAILGEELDFLHFFKRYYGEIGSTYSRVLYGIIDTFIHDNLRPIWETAIINMIEGQPWIKIVMMNRYPKKYTYREDNERIKT